MRRGKLALPEEVFDTSKQHLDVVYRYGIAETYASYDIDSELKPQLRYRI